MAIILFNFFLMKWHANDIQYKIWKKTYKTIQQMSCFVCHPVQKGLVLSNNTTSRWEKYKRYKKACTAEFGNNIGTDEGQPRSKYIFNKCGTNIYFFLLYRGLVNHHRRILNIGSIENFSLKISKKKLSGKKGKTGKKGQKLPFYDFKLHHHLSY